MKKEHMTVGAIREIAHRIYEMKLFGTIATEVKMPGQFLHILPSHQLQPLLRRPISISHVNQEEKELTIVFRREGEGTTLLANKTPGDTVDVLGPLGNGFQVEEVSAGDSVLIVGGGVGVPPLYDLARALKEREANVTTVLGFENKEAMFYEKAFQSFGEVFVSTVDGSIGTKGFVTDVIQEKNISFDRLYACGPVPMLKALETNYPEAVGSLSLEIRMGCGIGACFACVCHVQGDASGHDYRKVCSDGPVFPWREVVL
ncbi:dihydroorotate dehydrogenase electron transfer subunit [Aliibacillus thermotolerans]|uniref:Dihydroorotate dehydrogenase B (NAD(+)), electron transfer subunit n=1 Tax=Aliibacillus thermotolerans TaxID=1834418 RepID=A0ABW0U3E9_9BACI|nr:dihydroorotate dehydrogenase electron transfer subunit [Aliibacillus thermotolerans]MDA3130978.1 dihydroorotate dehydrogenase electron transfer subunit [Aliibacillus thermotolerans]